eukprot:COSAG05_NODE_40_length_27088_cov_92.858276_10_plen_37_part_00
MSCTECTSQQGWASAPQAPATSGGSLPGTLFLTKQL